MSTNTSRRPFVIAAVMASIAMVAIEATIISTAMPQIVSNLGGLHLFSWVFSSFLLTQTTMTVVFGKLADSFGRKRVILAGIAIFLIGSLLSGFAWSMPAMIGFRLIQGIGAGSIQPVTLTIVGDLYPARERGKVQGYLASVWAVAAVIGPMAGAMIIHNLSWAWVFWINIPIGLLSAAGFAFFLHEEKKHERHSIDVIGAGLFALAVAALMIALTSATADHLRALVALGVFMVSAALFVIQERRADDPMVSLQMWARRAIAATNGATVFSGMALMGLTTFLPMYVQGVLHRTPVVAGFALTMVMLGWPAGATIAARSFNRFALRQILVAGSAVVPLGAIIFVMLTPQSSPVMAALGSLIMGFGMGAVSVSSLVLIQESVSLSQRGSATASNLFSRNLGSTLGATLFGAVMNHGLSHSGKHGVVTSDQLRRVIEAAPNDSGNFDAVRLALHHSVHITFVGIFLISVAIAVAALIIPAVASARRNKHVQQTA
ncbi:MDR family MFS transporter [Paraburkholderia strydomiana]|uniref:MDR family MFS transporter n=1 Tax=Paraburkholderia strydomiana TaxID=1245417 RepID=UPI0038BB11EE